MRRLAANIDVAEALKLLGMKDWKRPTLEDVKVSGAFGRVLAQDVVARFAVPSRHTSHMDGYAVRAADIASAERGRPVSLKLRGEVKLGEKPRAKLGRGEAVAVSTGSYMPEGSDAVLMVEDATTLDGVLRTEKSLERWENVYQAGADLKEGELILQRGRVLRAQDVGMLMLLGSTSASVFRRPKVGLLATGDELTDSLRPEPGKVVNTHAPIFFHILREVGCEPVHLGIAPDEGRKLAAAVRKALDRSDLVLMMGGTSMGVRDLGESSLERLQPEAVFHGLKLDRGRVTGGAVIGGKPVLMLPGPIQAAMNSFLLVALPLIRERLGGADLVTKVPARLAGDWRARKRFRDFTKVVYLKISRAGQTISAEPLVAETESMTLLTAANAFAILPPEVTELRAGEELEAVLLPGFSSA